MRGIEVDDQSARAEAQGFNEVRDRIPVLTRIHVDYTLRIGAGSDHEKVERALASHVDKCPTAQSLRGAVEVTWDAKIEEIA